MKYLSRSQGSLSRHQDQGSEPQVELTYDIDNLPFSNLVHNEQIVRRSRRKQGFGLSNETMAREDVYI